MKHLYNSIKHKGTVALDDKPVFQIVGIAVLSVIFIMCMTRLHQPLL
jgi:hypothetical protein